MSLAQNLEPVDRDLTADHITDRAVRIEDARPVVKVGDFCAIRRNIFARPLVEQIVVSNRAARGPKNPMAADGDDLAHAPNIHPAGIGSK